MLLPGDLSYADDYNLDDRFGYQPRWDAWGRLSQKLFGTVPLISGIGARLLSPSAVLRRAVRAGRGAESRMQAHPAERLKNSMDERLHDNPAHISTPAAHEFALCIHGALLEQEGLEHPSAPTALH